MTRIILDPDNPDRRTSWPSPDEALLTYLDEAIHNQPGLSRSGMLVVVAAAQAYCELLLSPAGTEAQIRNLRALRRAVRNRRPATQGGPQP